MFIHRRKLGYWVAMEFHGVTEHMGEHFRHYIDGTQGGMRSPELAFRGPGGAGQFRELMFYGCFVAFQPAAFASPQYRAFFAHMDSMGGTFRYRWDEQYFYTMFAALSMNASAEVEYMDYVNVTHQGISEPWPIPPL